LPTLSFPLALTSCIAPVDSSIVRIPPKYSLRAILDPSGDKSQQYPNDEVSFALATSPRGRAQDRN
jgi:hypothetical protein